MPPRLAGTLGLFGTVIAVTALFAAAAALAGVGSGLSPTRLIGEFAHTLVPIVAGYVVAHYWSLLILVGQETVARLSDPLGVGADWLGTRDLEINGTLADPNLVAVLQVTAIVTGHVLGVVLAHDRALRLLPRRHFLAGQTPLMLVMVAYTVGGLLLLFAA